MADTTPTPDSDVVAYMRERDARRRRGWITAAVIAVVAAIIGFAAWTYIDGQNDRDDFQDRLNCQMSSDC